MDGGGLRNTVLQVWVVVKHLLLLTLTTISLVRLMPYLLTGIPYHTDSYALLPLMDLLKIKTPTELSPHTGFDNYNVYWPGVITYAVLHSEVIGLKPSSLTPITLPVINSLSILPFAVMLRVLGMSRAASLAASLIYGLAGTEAVLGAGITKEGYALTLAMLVMYLTTLIVLRYSKYVVYLTLMTYLTLVLTHHLTSVITLLIITYLALSYLAGKVLVSRLKVLSAVLAVNSLMLTSYIYVYSGRALPVLATLTEADAISLIAYEVTAMLPVWFSLIVRRELTDLIKLWFVIAYISVIALALLSTRVELTLGAIRVGPYELVLFTPYLVVAAVAVFSVGRVCEQYLSTFTYLTVLGLLGIEYYLIFGSPGLIGEAYRLSTFMYIWVAVLAAYTLSTSRFKVLVGMLIVAALLICVYVVPYTAFNSGYVGGSQRTYLESDLLIAEYVRNYGGREVFCGDLRFMYLLYPSVNVDVSGGLKYLLRTSNLNCYLVVNELFKDVGYIASLYGVPVSFDSGMLVNNSLIYTGGRNSMISPKNTFSRY